MLNDLRKAVPEGCLSDHELDELEAGELDVSRVEPAGRHLRSCARCTERQRALQAAARDFLARHPEPPSVTVPRKRRPGGRFYAGFAAGLALAAGIALFVRNEHPGETADPAGA